MPRSRSHRSTCPLHGQPSKRSTCRYCNAAYMRDYLRQRRVAKPSKALWERARKRARDRDLHFAILDTALVIPKRCPALGIPLILGARRSPYSPSLDRVVPAKGYVPGNVRVISDRANRLKGRRTLSELYRLSESGPAPLRAEYALIAEYVNREQLLAEVHQKAHRKGREGAEWAKIAKFLDAAFNKMCSQA